MLSVGKFRLPFPTPNASLDATSSSAFWNDTVLTAPLDDILNDMRMRDFASHAPPSITAVIFFSSSGELVKDISRFLLVRVWICVEEAREMVDVATGEADESFLVCKIC